MEIRLGRIAGADILVRPSILLLAIALVAIYTPQFDELVANAWLAAVIFAIALLVSVFIHELAHLVAAKAFSMRVPSITLHAFGGFTEVQGTSRTPGQELTIAIVGPLASALIGIAGLWGSNAVEAGILAVALWATGMVNLILAIANLLPSMPLDGGRAMRALGWLVTGSEYRGVVAAAWTGRASAVAVLGWGVLTSQIGTSQGFTRLVIAGLVALFLWQGAQASLAHDGRVARMNGLVARDLAVAEPPPESAPRVAAHLAGRDLLMAMAENPADHYALVEPDGTTHLTLHAATVDRAYRGES